MFLIRFYIWIACKPLNFRIFFYYLAKAQRGRVFKSLRASLLGFDKLSMITALFASAGARGENYAVNL